MYDGEDPQLTDTDYTDEATAITAHFSGFASSRCGGVYRYEWAVGEEWEGEGRESVMGFTSSGIVVTGTNGSGYAQVRTCMCAFCEYMYFHKPYTYTVHVYYYIHACVSMCEKE